MMNRRLLPLNSLRAFEVTGTRHSFTKAAETLSVTQSAISRHVINLEDLLGVKLFERRPHTLELTEQGKALLPALTHAFDTLEEALNRLQNEETLIPLKVSFPPTFAHYGAAPLLTEFQNENPEITLHLSTPRRPTELRKDNLDLAVIYSTPQVSDYVMDLLWQEKITPLCHPSLLSEDDIDKLDVAQIISKNQTVHVKTVDGPFMTWDNWLRKNGLSKDTQTSPVFDTAHLAAQYVISGNGIFISDPKLFAKEIAAGQLIAPFPELIHESGYGYYSVCLPEDMNHFAVQQLRNWLIERFSDKVN
ncbi:LysR substrate-binding domain-containing protein [Curvivirga aplysinae]|uniref:LysR substrate-binding domain-containing protein n=1 Tax=Curvivirga aplysinae TaxID=2529852 RepID=UPI0012BC927C|nr:LysR substrate-binding domain-containing protein [Curvivirga aplysinae]MTI10999.1 LysR family transcriptional regulator [Curvivirga aplysinae]